MTMELDKAETVLVREAVEFYRRSLDNLARSMDNGPGRDAIIERAEHVYQISRKLIAK